MLAINGVGSSGGSSSGGAIEAGGPRYVVEAQISVGANKESVKQNRLISKTATDPKFKQFDDCAQKLQLDDAMKSGIVGTPSDRISLRKRM